MVDVDKLQNIVNHNGHLLNDVIKKHNILVGQIENLKNKDDLTIDQHDVSRSYFKLEDEIRSLHEQVQVLQSRLNTLEN